MIAGFAAETLEGSTQFLDFGEVTRRAVGFDVVAEGPERLISSAEGSFEKESLKAIAAEIRNSCKFWPVNLIITDLPHDNRESGLEMLLAAELNVETVFVRLKSARKINRVVITTGGGPHALVGLKYGHKAATALNAETQALRIVRSSEAGARNGTAEAYQRKISDLISIQAAMAGITIPVKTVMSDSVVDSILEHCTSDDLLVMGVTSKWRYIRLSGSLPDEVARRAPCSVMIVYAPVKETLPLAEVFWERNIIINPAYEDRWQLLSLMVDRLIEDRQIPPEMRARVTATVYNREFEDNTSPGHGIAIPHAAMSDFEGTVGCLAIFDEPVDFGGTEVSMVFLLITPEHDYQEYLTILGKVASLALNTELRKQIMQADNAAEVVTVLSEIG
jgi:mannitol/fructose-specific phosphotransferase system IIA component (Ntr-type)/nucleotide-binding universal stress UspA family protein